MDLSDYRKEIDEIDEEMTRLFEKRMDVAVKVAEYKINNKLPIFNGGREAEVIHKNVKRLKNSNYESLIRKYFNHLMELSRALQQKRFNEINNYSTELSGRIRDGKLGFQGLEGSFSEEAMIKYFGGNRETSHYETFEDVFEALKKNEIDYGILLVENTSTGAITEVYDLMNKYGFYIVGEECIKIKQHLIGLEGATLDNIKEVYSHPQGFQQSSEFLNVNKEWVCIPYYNTATSVKKVYDLNDVTKVAIGSERAAKLYGLKILVHNINNQCENQTRFLIIGRNLEVNENCDKVSVIFSLEDEVGTLYSLLNHFAENNINLKKIESRPIKNSPWKYLLYVDFDGNLNSIEVKNALKLIQKNSEYFKLLGNYKKFS